MEAAGTHINMGDKIKFLEAQFNPDRGRRDNGPLSGAVAPAKKAYPLTDRLYQMEARVHGDSSRPPKPQSKEEQPAKADRETVERLLQDYRTNGRNGLESKYGPELIRQVLFEDKKRYDFSWNWSIH